MHALHLKVIAPLALVAILAGACGSDSADDAATSTTAPTASASQGTDAGASSLRSGLTALLQEHVYLAGITTGTALDGGDFKVPAATLDANSVALSEAIGSVYGGPAGTQFLELWRKHIGFFVDYTVATAKSDDAAKEKARTALDGYRADFGAFLSSANPNLPKDAVAEELKPHVASLFAAIDAQGAKDPKAFDLLRTAAGHMPMTANVLAGGIVKQFPDKFPGNTDSGPSTLRSGLTALLQEHVYLAGITTGTALDGGDFKVPAATLDANSVALSEAIGSVYGGPAGTQFLELWRKHIGFFVDYTVATAKSDDAAKEKARTALDGYRADFGAFLSSANPNLPKDAVAEELKPHVASLFAAIDAQGAKDPKAFDLLRTAAGHMPMTANVLAGGIVKQFPDKFPG